MANIIKKDKQEFIGLTIPRMENGKLVGSALDIISGNRVLINGRVYHFDIKGETVSLWLSKCVGNFKVITDSLFNEYIKSKQANANNER